MKLEKKLPRSQRVFRSTGHALLAKKGRNHTARSALTNSIGRRHQFPRRCRLLGEMCLLKTRTQEMRH